MRQVTKQRWDEAQDYEKKYWRKMYSSREVRLKKNYELIKCQLLEHIKLNKNSKILEVGCGPEHIIHYWKDGKTYAIDPLINYFKKIGIMKKGKVRLSNGVGESLPYKNNFFDIILIINVLDHCQNPEKVLSEIKRCLKKNGAIYLRVSVRPNYLLPILKIMWKTKILVTKGHPFLFTEKNIAHLLKNGGFYIKKSWLNKDKFKFKFLFNLKELFQFITEYQYICICKI